jgi:hypothetical protein
MHLPSAPVLETHDQRLARHPHSCEHLEHDVKNVRAHRELRTTLSMSRMGRKRKVLEKHSRS